MEFILQKHCHIQFLKYADEINQALQEAGKFHSCLSTADKDNLAKVVEVMQYFAQATDSPQGEKKATFHSVIPVHMVDSLENGLMNGIN